MAFDVISRLALQMARPNPSVKATGASFGWGIDDPQDIEKPEPRFEPIAELRTPDLLGYSRLLWVVRALVPVMGTVPALRRPTRLLVYRF